MLTLLLLLLLPLLLLLLPLLLAARSMLPTRVAGVGTDADSSSRSLLTSVSNRVPFNVWLARTTENVKLGVD